MKIFLPGFTAKALVPIKEPDLSKGTNNRCVQGFLFEEITLEVPGEAGEDLVDAKKRVVGEAARLEMVRLM